MPTGEPWAKLTDDLGVFGLKHVVIGALYQVYALRSVGPSTVMIEEGGQERALCLSPIKPRGLIVLPLVQDMRAVEGKAGAGARRPLLYVKAGAAEMRFDVDHAGPTGSLGEGDTGGSPRFVDLFWKIYSAGTGATLSDTPSGQLTLSSMELSVPASFAQVKDASLRQSARAGGNISVTVPFLTNHTELRRGDVLWCSRT